MANAGGWQKHVWFKKESTWGTPVTADIWLPVDAYDVVAKPEFYSNAGAFVGVVAGGGAQRGAGGEALRGG